MIIETDTKVEETSDIVTAPIVHLDHARAVEDKGAKIQESSWPNPPKPRCLPVPERLSAVVKSQKARRKDGS